MGLANAGFRLGFRFGPKLGFRLVSRVGSKIYALSVGSRLWVVECGF